MLASDQDGRLVVTFIVCLAGCAPQLADDRNVSLEIGEIKTVAVAPINREQTIRISARSPGAPISIHVYLPEHEEAIERKITLGKPPENLLASAEDVEEVELAAKVPANEEAIVRLQPASRKAANVHLTINN